MKTLMQKPKKQPPAKCWGTTPKLKTSTLDLAKPIQGQGEGSVIFAPDYDPCAPAFAETDWKN